MTVSDKIKQLHLDGRYKESRLKVVEKAKREALRAKFEILKNFGYNGNSIESIDVANKWLINNNKIELLDLSLSKYDITLGYEYIYSPNHPMANLSGKIYTHRYVYSLFHNEYVKDDEHIHHKDENKRNNDPLNLEKHSSSEHSKIHHPILEQEYECLTCKKIITIRKRYDNTYCSRECFTQNYIMHKRKFDPTKEELEKIVWEMSTVKVAEYYGVSDKAVEKRCKLLGISKPPRGYWSKLQAKNA